MSTEKIILIGGGGHCKAAIDVIESKGEFEIFGILDIPEKVGQTILGYPIIGTDSEISKFAEECRNFHITVGQIKSANLRKKLFKMVKDNGGYLPVIASKNAHVSKHSSIKEGTIVMHNVIVNPGAQVGACCILNSGSLIEHDAQIGDFNHISTNAVINGDCKVENECFIGSNSVISNGVSIPSETLIAAGAAVYKTIKQSGTYMGFPLRKIK